jgi:hypothetical protein
MHSERTVLENVADLKMGCYETYFDEIYIEGGRGAQELGC